MTTDSDNTGLVRQAQLGDRQSMDDLAEEARRRLAPYLYRLTLNHDLAQDLLQETLLKMVESIKDLERPDRFWPWLFRTAMGQVQHHYRDRARAQEIEFSRLCRQRLSEHITQDHDDGLNGAMRRELVHTVVAAMADLKLSYRNVLALRCYEQMSYAQIADLMDCKELRARVLFFRAKRVLAKRLARKGFDRGLLLTGLGLFGLLTSSADGVSAAGTLTAASLQVGAVATFAGVVATPKGVGLMLSIAGMTITLTLVHFAYFLVFLGAVVAISIISAFYD